MPREKKAQIIDQVAESFRKSKIGVLTDYRGLTAAEMGGLRRKLKQSGVEFRVVKNTLSRQAASRLGRNGLDSLFRGPVAIALGYGEESQVPKMLDEYIRSTRSTLSIRGGFLGASPLTAQDVAVLSYLPSREVLISRVMGGLQAPIAGLVGVLAAPIRGFSVVLQGRIKQLEAK